MENIKNEILKDKKKYSLKPYYVAKVQVQACNLELLLNDIPIFNYSVTGGMSNEIPLNSYILESGNQILKIRLTPISNHQKLSKQVDFSIDLGYSNVVNENTLDKYIETVNYDLQQKIKEKELPFFEIEIPFQALVPWDYSNILKNAQTLSSEKLNYDNLVNNFYKILEQRNTEEYTLMLKNKIKRQADVKYSSKKEIEILIKELDLSRIKKLFPLTEYNVKFYAHGKLIRFISKSSEDNANKYLFRFTVPPLMEGKQDGESALNYLFYLPKGKTELEIF